MNHPEKVKVDSPALTVKKVGFSDEKILEASLRTNPNIYEETLANYPKILA